MLLVYKCNSTNVYNYKIGNGSDNYCPAGYASEPVSDSNCQLKVTLDPADGRVNSDVSTTTISKIKLGTTLYGGLPTASKTGYDFKGWYTSETGGTSITGTSTVTKTGTQTLYAQWKKNSTDTGGGDSDSGTTKVTYSISYNANSGTGSMSKSSHTNGTEKALTLNSFTKTGYIFKNWNTKSDGTGTSYSDGQIVDNLTNTNGATIVLYAQWQGNIYKVNYNGNGNDSGTMSATEHTYGVLKALSKNTYIKEGYTFKSWNTKADGTGINYTDGQQIKDLTSKANDNITLYARWEANDDVGNKEEKIIYYIKYDANGGSGSMPNSEHQYGYASGLMKNTYTLEGYKFLGWNTRKDGTGIMYSDEQTISNLGTDNGYVVTLYANWVSINNNSDEDNDNNNNQDSDIVDNNSSNNDTNNNIVASPQTGVLALILVSLISIGSVVGIVYYRRKVKC